MVGEVQYVKEIIFWSKLFTLDGNAPVISGPTGTTESSVPQGDNGDTVPPFGQELQVRGVLSPPVTVQPNSFGVVEAVCAPDEVATGGGLLVQSPPLNGFNPSLINTGFTPSNAPNMWVVQYHNAGEFQVLIHASATCAKLVDAS